MLDEFEGRVEETVRLVAHIDSRAIFLVDTADVESFRLGSFAILREVWEHVGFDLNVDRELLIDDIGGQFAEHVLQRYVLLKRWLEKLL